MTSQAARRAEGSKPVVGSSRKMSSGLPMSASAKSSRRRWPPDSRVASVPALPVRPTRAMVSSMSAVRLVEYVAPLAEARLAAARGDTATAISALRGAADGGRRVGSVMFVPAAVAGLACLAAIAGDHATAAAAVGEARAELGGRRQAISLAALRYAEGVMAWHRGELAAAEHLVREATVQWHRGCDRMGACDGIELLGVLAAARERHPNAARLLAAAAAARPPLRYLAPGYTAKWRPRGDEQVRPARQTQPRLATARTTGLLPGPAWQGAG